MLIYLSVPFLPRDDPSVMPALNHALVFQHGEVIL